MSRRLQIPGLPAVLAAFLVLAASVTAGAQQAPGERTTLDSVFNIEQATRGQAVFRDVCASCHTTAEFQGTEFVRTWTGRRIFDLFDQVRMSMPMDAPGRLSRQEYVDIIAYVLRLNAYPAGDAPLLPEDDALKLIRVQPRPASH
jgi:S-disulfanyl-L-cysteine oxidoreductase SoxD